MHGKVIRFGVTACVSVALAGAIASSFAVVGCGNLCDRNPDEPSIAFKAGATTNAGTQLASYETSGYIGPYLPFPPGRTYRLFHALGACPKNVQAWFAFEVSPASGSKSGPDKGGTAPAAGNQFTVERVTPDFVDVRNDTCSDVYLRVYVSDPDFTGGACTAPGEDAGNARTPSTVDAAAGATTVTGPDAGAP
ncbi:MAG TPA: hypothetical protein VH062_10410 [Polyangiaceae bacterium]|nr:hypothetical protein [Polyangiaceae bacterium]